MLDKSALKDFRPLFLVPCAGGKVFDNCVMSLLGLLNGVWAHGFQADFRVFNGFSLVTRVRNEALIPFLAEDRFTHLFWIDADIGFSADAAIRLLLSDLDVVAGPYPLKRKATVLPGTLEGLDREQKIAAQTRFPVNNVLSDGTKLPITPDVDGFLEVAEAPTGFMCIKRSVMMKMMEVYPELQYIPDGPPDPIASKYCYRFFDTMMEPETRRFLSEDYAFCRRWRDCGGKVHIDTTAKLTHMGQHLFKGDFAETLRLAPYNAVGGPA